LQVDTAIKIHVPGGAISKQVLLEFVTREI